MSFYFPFFLVFFYMERYSIFKFLW